MVAVLRALPETDGTYNEVIKRAGEYGGDVSQHTLGKWVSTGRNDLKAGKRQTAFARFAQRYDQVMEEHCNADANRNRELDEHSRSSQEPATAETRRLSCQTASSPTNAGNVLDLDGTGRQRRRAG